MDAEEANKFINSLVKNLQVLCHGHVHFNSSIQVIGHLYLNVDSNVNIDYIVNEKVCKSDTSSTVFVSNSYHSEPHKKNHNHYPGSGNTGTSRNQNKNRPSEDLEASVDLTDDGVVVQRLMPINFGSNNSSPSAIHPAYRDPGHPIHHSRKSRKPYHHIEASTPAKSPRLSLNPNPSPRSLKNDNIIRQEQLSSDIGIESDFSNSTVPRAGEESMIDNNTASMPIESENPENSQFELSLKNIKNEPEDASLDQNSSLFEQQLGSNSSQPTQHSDASADEEFFSGLRDKTLGVFPVALHSSDQVMGSENVSSLSQPSTSFKEEMGDFDPGSGARNLDSTLNISPDAKKKRKCSHCGAEYNKAVSLYRHIKDKHFPSKFQCPICGRIFARKFTAFRHLATHSKA